MKKKSSPLGRQGVQNSFWSSSIPVVQPDHANAFQCLYYLLIGIFVVDVTYKEFSPASMSGYLISKMTEAQEICRRDPVANIMCWGMLLWKTIFRITFHTLNMFSITLRIFWTQGDMTVFLMPEAQHWRQRVSYLNDIEFMHWREFSLKFTDVNFPSNFGTYVNHTTLSRSNSTMVGHLPQ